MTASSRLFLEWFSIAVAAGGVLLRLSYWLFGFAAPPLPFFCLRDGVIQVIQTIENN
jgi:hypothetical protein